MKLPRFEDLPMAAQWRFTWWTVFNGQPWAVGGSAMVRLSEEPSGWPRVVSDQTDMAAAEILNRALFQACPVGNLSAPWFDTDCSSDECAHLDCALCLVSLNGVAYHVNLIASVANGRSLTWRGPLAMTEDPKDMPPATGWMDGELVALVMGTKAEVKGEP